MSTDRRRWTTALREGTPHTSHHLVLWRRAWAAAGGPVDAAVDPETVSSCCGRVYRRAMRAFN
jgi:hypothetical protein